MIYYYSAPTNYKKELFDVGVKSFLLSFAVDAGRWEEYYNLDIPLIIDSGAFTAWNSGKQINIEDYKNFCIKLPEDTIFVSLDIIPTTASFDPNETEKCCEQGYENFIYLKRYLKNVLPVYHYKDNIKWLKKYIEHTDYVGISPANDTQEEVKRLFLDYVFKQLPRNIKTHSFGYTAGEGLKHYPFYSVDSTSWKGAHRFGNVIYFLKNNIVSFDIRTFALQNNFEYSPSLPLSKEVISAALKHSIKSIDEFMRFVTEQHQSKNFKYLEMQQELFAL